MQCPVTGRDGCVIPATKPSNFNGLRRSGSGTVLVTCLARDGLSVFAPEACFNAFSSGAGAQSMVWFNAFIPTSPQHARRSLVAERAQTLQALAEVAMQQGAVRPGLTEGGRHSNEGWGCRLANGTAVSGRLQTHRLLHTALAPFPSPTGRSGSSTDPNQSAPSSARHDQSQSTDAPFVERFDRHAFPRSGNQTPPHAPQPPEHAGQGSDHRLTLLLSWADWRPSTWVNTLPPLLEPLGISSVWARSAREAERVIRTRTVHIAIVDLGVPLDGRCGHGGVGMGGIGGAAGNRRDQSPVSSSKWPAPIDPSEVPLHHPIPSHPHDDHDPSREHAGTRILDLLRRLETPPPTVILKDPHYSRDEARHLRAALHHDAFAVLDRAGADAEQMLKVLMRVMQRFYQGRWPMCPNIPASTQSQPQQPAPQAHPTDRRPGQNPRANDQSGGMDGSGGKGTRNPLDSGPFGHP